MGNIREHILSVESMKEGCNDEERQDNSQAGENVKGAIHWQVMADWQGNLSERSRQTHF